MSNQNGKSVGFSGKKCIVTGAGRGIGRAIVAELHSQGAIVYAVSKTPENLQTLKQEFPNVIPICVDFSNWEDTKSALEPIEVVDCLINNAALLDRSEFLSISQQSIEKLFSVNLNAVVLISQIVARKMIEKGNGGCIINMSSICAQRAFLNCGIYCCTKAALDMLTRSMALELGPHKIRVNSVNPAAVFTEMAHPTACDTTTSKKVETIQQTLISRTPTQTLWMPMSDVVNITLFLASNSTSQITGQCVAVDGGFLSN